MRLSSDQVAAITSTIVAYDPQCEIYLFGSRVDDTARGGDIDLLILSEEIDLAKKLEIGIKLKDHLGEQRIDLIIASDQQMTAFVRDAKARGVKLR